MTSEVIDRCTSEVQGGADTEPQEAAVDHLERLRSVLAANALVSGLVGAVCTIAADPVADVLGVSRVGLVRLIGIGLVIFAVDLLVLWMVRPRWLVPGARIVAGTDAAWSAGTVAVTVAGALDPIGAALVLATGVVTAEFAYLEWTGARHAARLTPTAQDVAA